MAQVYMAYNPYRMDTRIWINGREILDDDLLQYVRGKRLQEWVGDFPQKLADAQNEGSFDMTFHGTALDYDDFEEAFKSADQDKENNFHLRSIRFEEGKPDADINQKIVDVFTRLQKGPVDDFRNPQLEKAFHGINNAVFPINIIGTMSSGKSTLINALLGRQLMPSANQACTDKITEILDNDDDRFHAVVYDADGNMIQEIQDLTYDIMEALNKNKDVREIDVEGNIPFLTSDDTALKLIDTPGTNNSQNQEHKNTTYRALESSSNSLVIYILNGTQLCTYDDDTLLKYVAEQIRKGGKQVRDRFLFVVNKMDCVNTEKESVSGILQAGKEYLEKHGIENAQIFPCSAFLALILRTDLKNIALSSISMQQMFALSQDGQKAVAMGMSFKQSKDLHFERYSTLCPSAQSQLDYQLKQAEAENDWNAQLLIHSGICSLEAAITAYVKKYAKTKKIKDLVESFEQILDSTQILAKAKTQVANDEKIAEACAERAAIVRAKIDNGQEAQAFKEKVQSIDPVPEIEARANEKKAQIVDKIGKKFARYGITITDKAVAKSLIDDVAYESSELIAQMTADLEALIDKEVVGVGTDLLTQYQEKLLRIDENASDKQLDFSTVDLIKGALSNLQETAAYKSTDNYDSGTVNGFGETTYEEKEVWDKVDEEEVQVFDHNEKVKVGTEKVWCGRHKEAAGTRTVKNEHKRWFKPWTWLEESYHDETVYKDVDDYRDNDIYETKAVFRTEMRDVFEKRIEKTEKYEVLVADIQAGMMGDLARNIDEGIKNAMNYAKEQVGETKKQFSEMFDELDQLIKEKYKELELVAEDQKSKEETLRKNRDLLNWIEGCKAEIEDALNI